MSTRRRKGKRALSAADAAAIVLAIPEAVQQPPGDPPPVGQWQDLAASGRVLVWWGYDERELSVLVCLATRKTVVSMRTDPTARGGNPLRQHITVGELDPAGQVLDLVRLIEVGWDWLTGRKIPHDWPAHVPDQPWGVGGHEVADVPPCACRYTPGEEPSYGVLAAALVCAGARSAALRDAGCQGKGGAP